MHHHSVDMAVLFHLVVFCLALTAMPASGREYFVDQKNPAAADKNPGTQTAPFKTIQAAVDKVQPGDTIWVKAGDYEEPVEIKKAGEEDRRAGAADKAITISAWKDDRVRVGCQPRPLPVEGEWMPIPGSKSWQIKLTQDMPKDFLLLLDGKPILTWTQDAPPKDEKVNWSAYRKSDRTLMFNANGKNPKQLGKFEYGRRMDCFRLLPPTIWWVIRKIEFSWATTGIFLVGHNCAVEDCFFSHCYRAGIINFGHMTVVRRCNFLRCGCGFYGGGSIAPILEDNLLVECGMLPEDDIMLVEIPGCQTEWAAPVEFKGNTLSMLFTHNILSDNCGRRPGGRIAPASKATG